MNQGLTYAYSSDPRSNANGQNQQINSMSFHPSSYQATTYTNSTTAPFHSSTTATFIPGNVSIQQGQQRRLGADDKNLATMLDAYFVDNTAPSTSSSWSTQQTVQSVQVPQLQQPLNTYQQVVEPLLKTVKIACSPDKAEKERQKKARQAEAARMRYHRLTPEEKRELNLKRTLAQKRKRQREKEMEELESILRETNDIQEDPDITEQLREKRMRAKWAEAARTRYARMTPEERRAHNNRRRMRQMQNALAAIKSERQLDSAGHVGGDVQGIGSEDSLLLGDPLDPNRRMAKVTGVTTGDPIKDEEAVRQHIKQQNAKKAEAARQRYHRMSDEEKRVYNQRRTEAFRRRRMEEEMLLAMPIGRINGEALDRAQQIVVRNAKRAEAARLRYQRMTPDQRKSYNQKRYTPKRRRGDGDTASQNGLDSSNASSTGIPTGPSSAKKDDLDALSTLERDVLKRTQQAQQAILRQQRTNAIQEVARAVSPSSQTYILQPTNGQSHLGGQQFQLQLGSNGIGHQQVVHSVHQLPVSHQVSASSLDQKYDLGQQIYTAGGMMISGQQHSQQAPQQILNPYGQQGRA
ncbi:unnamed protein product [Caenorhabditis auriculariae]|uniref:Uncharacterized protein n=1 Tax=Caenorhabditis auriculariae TaxID=2777116 RepID=A0A8S1GY53_9PELO|nr:unnamed protein product [Caenorhabditis auriculariae]